MYQAPPLAQKPRRKWLWRLLAMLGAIIAVGGVGGAFIGKFLERLDSGASRSHRPPIGRAIPVGRAASIGDGFRLEVLRVTAEAERQAKAETKRFPPPRGSRYFLIRLALTYTGSGVGQIGEVTGNALRVVSADGVSYSIFQNGSCGIFPPDDLEDVVTVHPGQTERGYLCMPIGRAARPRLLHTGDFQGFFVDMKALRDRWFRLR